MTTPPQRPSFPTPAASWMIGVALLVGALLAGVALDRCACGSKETDVIVPADVDAGPGELAIAARLDASVQAEEARIRQLEADHAKQIAAFDEQERTEYAAQKARGRAALAAWLSERNRRLLDAGL